AIKRTTQDSCRPPRTEPVSAKGRKVGFVLQCTPHYSRGDYEIQPCYELNITVHVTYKLVMDGGHADEVQQDLGVVKAGLDGVVAGANLVVGRDVIAAVV